jgi:hypothetical protein
MEAETNLHPKQIADGQTVDVPLGDARYGLTLRMSAEKD